MIQAYYGNGKGKTTSAIGSAIRCTGDGNKVLFVQFLKNNDSSEFKVLNSVEGIDILFSKEKYELYDNKKKELGTSFFNAYNKLLFEEAVSKADMYQMLILDEIIDAVEFGYISEDKLLDMLNEYKNTLEIILTGHSITEKIANISDYISEIKEIKHPYNKGILSRKGIEY